MRHADRVIRCPRSFLSVWLSFASTPRKIAEFEGKTLLDHEDSEDKEYVAER